MEELIIEATKATPRINFDPEDNHLVIKGESYPENSFKFYDPLFNWLEDYSEELEQGEKVEVELSLEYLNTSSTKSIMSILDILEEAYQNGVVVELNWYYNEDNELSYEMAKDFKDYLEVPLNLLVESE
ncbi:MAG: DUF1987 domain-containing protein [Bacillota bacterium]